MITFFRHADYTDDLPFSFYLHFLRFDWIQSVSDFRGAPVADGGQP